MLSIIIFKVTYFHHVNNLKQCKKNKDNKGTHNRTSAELLTESYLKSYF